MVLSSLPALFQTTLKSFCILALFYRWTNWSSEKLGLFLKVKILIQGRSRIWILNFLLHAWASFNYMHTTSHKYESGNYHAQNSTRHVASPALKGTQEGHWLNLYENSTLHFCLGNIPLSAVQRLDLKAGQTIAAASFRVWLSRWREITLQTLSTHYLLAAPQDEVRWNENDNTPLRTQRKNFKRGAVWKKMWSVFSSPLLQNNP